MLTIRWSGARREEIGRLSLECLDCYPDGTARLHFPAGKTKRERIVPLNEAAVVIQEVQALRKQLAEKGAKLHTIMAVLGHASPHMTMV